MISRLRGLLAEREPTRVVLDCSGVGYELRVPLSTSGRLPEPGAEATLFVEMTVGRNGVALFGFITEAERETFRLLTSVQGIGPRAGLNLLSRLDPGEIRDVIATGRLEILRSVPGIGPKRAESILKKLQTALPAAPAAPPLLADGESALVSLGLTRKEARDRLARVKPVPEKLADLLRAALAETR